MVTTTKYMYFGNQYVGETDDAGTVTKRYVNEPDQHTHLFGQHDESTGDNHYHHYDAIGSTREVTDETETVTDEFTYDAWGNRLSRTGANDIPFQYVGEHGYYREDATESYYVMARTYQPGNIRWISVDLLFHENGSSLPYSYVDNSPVMLVDPSGLLSVCCEYSCGHPQEPNIFRSYTWFGIHRPLIEECQLFVGATTPRDCIAYRARVGGACPPKDPPTGVKQSSIEICRRRTNISCLVDALGPLLCAYHVWIRTPDIEVGLGPAEGGVPGNESDCPCTETSWNDHTGEGDKPGSECAEIKGCDLDCVEAELTIGKRKGAFTPTNQCNDTVTDVLKNVVLLGLSWVV